MRKRLIASLKKGKGELNELGESSAGKARLPTRSSRDGGEAALDSSAIASSPVNNEPRTLERTKQYGLFHLNPVTTDDGGGGGGGGRESVSYQLDIVAIHGITGDAYRSWTHDNGKLWLRDFLPARFPGARIYSFGYPAQIFHSTSTAGLENTARLLLEGLKDQRSGVEDESRQIIFVCHSMGGIVVKKALLIAVLDAVDYKKIRESISAILFFGTPHRGSELASLLLVVARIYKVVSPMGGLTGNTRTDLVQGITKDSELLKEISRSIRNQVTGIQIASFVETNITAPLNCVIVDYSSATMNIPGERIVPMHGCNHRNICQFGDETTFGYKTVLEILKEWADSSKRDNTKLGDDDLECLQSLSFPKMELRREEAKRAHPDTCLWILKDVNYTTWKDQERGLLWIIGKPGSGKSTLMSYLYSQLKADVNLDVLVLDYFFHGRGEILQKTFIGMLRTLLHQVIRASPQIRATTTPHFREKKTFGKAGLDWNWELNKLKNLFRQGILTISSTRKVLIFVDALDEAAEEAQAVLDFLHDLNVQIARSNSMVKICVACRHYPVLAAQIPGLVVVIEQNNREDIKRYVNDKLRREIQTVEDSADRERLIELENEIASKASGRFQWALIVSELVIEQHRKGLSWGKIRRTIQAYFDLWNDGSLSNITKPYHEDDESQVTKTHPSHVSPDEFFLRETEQNFEISSASFKGYVPDSGYSSMLPQNFQYMSEKVRLPEAEQKDWSDVASVSPTPSLGEESRIGSIGDSVFLLLVGIFKNDSVLSPLFEESLHIMDMEKAVKNLKTFIDGFCVLLHAKDPNKNQSRAIQFIRHRTRQFAEHIYGNDSLVEEDPGIPVEAEAMKREKRRIMLANVERLLGGGNTKYDDPYSSEHLSSENPTLAIPNNDDLVNIDVPDPDDFLRYTAEIIAFLVEGEPMREFRLNYSRFVRGDSINDWTSKVKSQGSQSHANEKGAHLKEGPPKEIMVAKSAEPEILAEGIDTSYSGDNELDLDDNNDSSTLGIFIEESESLGRQFTIQEKVKSLDSLDQGRLLGYISEMTFIPREHLVAAFIEEMGSTSLANWLKLKLEDYTQQCWDWWPLLGPDRRGSEKAVSLGWICNCGHSKTANVKLDVLKPFLMPNPNPPNKTKPPDISSGQAPLSPSQAQPRTQISTPISMNSQTIPLDNLTSGSSANPQLSHRRVAGSSGNSITMPNERFVLFGVKHGTSTHLIHMDTMRKCSDDVKFFAQLKADYNAIYGPLRRIFHVKQYHHCDFVKFEKTYQGRIRYRGRGYPPNQEVSYHYQPRIDQPGWFDPPIHEEEFYERYYGCPNCSESRCKHTCPTTNNEGYIARIPKRIAALELKSPKQEEAWGLHAIQHVNFMRVILYHIFMLIGPILFWGLWLWYWKHKADLQNASVPLFCTIPILSLFWAMLKGNPSAEFVERMR